MKWYLDKYSQMMENFFRLKYSISLKFENIRKLIMDEESISKFLIDKEYFLTALELLSENYERTGVPIDILSNFFQDSANFLSFDSSHGINDVSPNTQQNSSTETIRIKNDKISVLEHDVRVLKDSLQEAQEKLKDPKAKLEVKSPSQTLTGNEDKSEEIVIKNLVLKYLQTKGFRITALSFQNEAGKTKKSDEIIIPDDVELIHLLRAFLYLQNTSKINIEIENLKKDKIESRDEISKLTVDLDVARKKIKDLELQVNQLLEEKEAKEEKEGKNDKASDLPEREQKIQQELEQIQEQQQEQLQKPSLNFSNDPPSVQLLDSVFADIQPLIKVLEPSKRSYLLGPLHTIVKNHPSRDVRMQGIQLIFNMWDSPDTDQRQAIVDVLKDCANEQDRAEAEILPVVTQMMSSSDVNILSLVSKTVGDFSTILNMQLRYTLLLSIIKQFSEHSSPVVRKAAAADGATLVLSLGSNDDATDKMEDLIDLGKHFVFDADADVSSAGLCAFIPAILRFAQLRKCVGKSIFEYWFKLALSFGTTGSSQLAVLRFKMCAQVLETTIRFILPSEPTNEQRIVSEDDPESKNEDNKEIVIVSQPEFEWITKYLPDALPKLSQILFVPIPVKKEAVKLVTCCCQFMGKMFTNEYIAPVFLKLIDDGLPDQKMNHLAMFICAVSPKCGVDIFYTNAKTFLTYAANETHEFKQTDVENYFSPAFSMLSSLEPSMRTTIFKLCNELSLSHRSGVRSAAMNVISEMLQTCEQKEIENDVFPIVVRLAHDPDESLQFETINVIGQIARFSTVEQLIDSIKSLFDEWFRSKPNIRLQALRSLLSVVNDVDSQFRDTYIIPKLLDIARNKEGWGDFYEQAIIIVVQSLSSMTEFSKQIIRDYIEPLVESLSEIPLVQNDPTFNGLREKFGQSEEKGGFSFLKKNI